MNDYELIEDMADESSSVIEDSEDAGICPHCNGSGEGQYDGTRCRWCKGTGEAK